MLPYGTIILIIWYHMAPPVCLGGQNMNIKLELLKSYISDYINSNLEDFEMDASQISDTIAIQILTEIQKVIKNEKYSDSEAIEEIVCIFEKYRIDFGFRHNF